VVGSFNDWSPSRTALQDETGAGRYSASVLVAPGRHEYKFVVNGRWCVDPKCEDPIVNGYGTLNGVVNVK
jgi:1,4-alpha-glucan branching enzyme